MQTLSVYDKLIHSGVLAAVHMPPACEKRVKLQTLVMLSSSTEAETCRGESCRVYKRKQFAQHSLDYLAHNRLKPVTIQESSTNSLTKSFDW